MAAHHMEALGETVAKKKCLELSLCVSILDSMEKRLEELAKFCVHVSNLCPCFPADRTLQLVGKLERGASVPIPSVMLM